MADEHWLKANIVYGSAGMAAAGMVPRKATQSRPVQPEVPVVLPKVEPAPEAPPAPEPEALEAVFAGDGTTVLGDVNWDQVFHGIQGIALLGASDPNAGSLHLLKQNTGIEEGYADYREMLARKKPNLVVIPQQGTANRYSIIKDCLMSSAHVLCPAPFTRTLEEADELVSLADRRGLKIAVANPMRVNPNVIKFLQMRHGLIGDLVEIRIYGNMEQICGGEDLLLFGAPLFDLIRMFAGNPVWCVGSAFTNGKYSTPEDIVDSSHDLWGPVVGDSITAQICMENNVFVNFVSNPKMKWVSNGWGMEIIGSHRIMRLHAGDQPELSLLENPGPKGPSAEERWQLWPENQHPYHLEDEELSGPDVANRVVVFDWLNAIAEDRPPCCSAERALRSMEIVHAIWESAISGRRVFFPLKDRTHPLEGLGETMQKTG